MTCWRRRMYGALAGSSTRVERGRRESRTDRAQSVDGRGLVGRHQPDLQPGEGRSVEPVPGGCAGRRLVGPLNAEGVVAAVPPTGDFIGVGAGAQGEVHAFSRLAAGDLFDEPRYQASGQGRTQQQKGCQANCQTACDRKRGYIGHSRQRLRKLVVWQKNPTERAKAIFSV